MGEALSEVATELVGCGKGILAADETLGTLGKRFALIGVESTEVSRAVYRDLLISTPGLGEFISGVILHDETIRQKSPQGEWLREKILDAGMRVGIKVDAGTRPLAKFPREVVTEGLDRLRQRLGEYREMGASFAKWRAVVRIGRGIPTLPCLHANAHALARYAALCQEAGLVPIVEPEVLMEGDHSLDTCSAVSELTLREVFAALAEFQVGLEEMLLKPNMIVPGIASAESPGVGEVAQRTLACLRRTVPAAVPGVVFLSGGQTETSATEHLAALNHLGAAPWRLSFSYGRALQESALGIWRADPDQRRAAQDALLQRARANSAACSVHA